NKKVCIGSLICLLFAVTFVYGQLHWREKIIKATNEIVQQDYEMIEQEEQINISPNYEMYAKNLPNVVKEKINRA
ncbi:EPSX protein, partial [Bacillus thuringiensis]|nr:EPSX protein [Bacillus thuringiensis]